MCVCIIVFTKRLQSNLKKKNFLLLAKITKKSEKTYILLCAFIGDNCSTAMLA